MNSRHEDGGESPFLQRERLGITARSHFSTDSLREMMNQRLNLIAHFTTFVAVIYAATFYISSTGADEDRPLATGVRPGAVARAERLMAKIDKDGSGTFEKSESAANWRKYRKLDTNRDDVLTVEELSYEPVAYLESTGERRLDVVYKTVGSKDLLLDLYYPANDRVENIGSKDAQYPVVVYTHGGGWAAGSRHGIAKASFAAVFGRLLEHGFAVASVNYRLCRKETDVTMRDCVIDCKDAVRYLAKNRQTLGLDHERVFVMGDSAGGHIAQMLLLASPETLNGAEELESASYNIVAGVSWYGPCDFEKAELFNHDDRPDFRDRFGPRILGQNTAAADKLTRYREMSSVNYLRADSPPLLMIQGDKDTTMPVKHAHYMQQRAAALDAPVEVFIVRNAGHNWRKLGAEIKPSRDVIVDRTVQFFADRQSRSHK